MAIYALLLSLFVSLFFTACQHSPDVPLSPELNQYALVKENCESLRTTPGIFVPDALDKECRSFVQRLNKVNGYDYELAKFRGEHPDENVNRMPEYIMMETTANRQHRKAELEYDELAKLLNSLSQDAIARDQLADVELTLRFPETRFTKEHYDYYRQYAPQFDNDPHYLAFEKEYSNELINLGLGYLTRGDKNGAIKRFKQAAALNNAQAEYLVGVIYEAKHVDKAIKWHTRAKEHGIESSNINLARLYTRKRMPKEAQKLYIEAAENGNAYVQYFLYKQYDKTTNTQTNETAQKWLKASAENGFPLAEYTYGAKLLKNNEDDKAKSWLLKAHEHGVSAANASLGALYYKRKEYTAALDYLEAAEDSASKYRLATMYEKGLGVDVDNYQAYINYKQAVKLGRKSAKKDVNRLDKLKTEKEKAHYSAAKRKERHRQEEAVEHFGEEPILRNLRSEGMRIRLQGIVTLPLQNGHGFILHNEEGRSFYVIDPEFKSGVKAYQYVDLSAIATGNAITVSSADGLTVDIYQLNFQKFCQR